MQDRSENQIISRLIELENEGLAERRVELMNEHYLTLLDDPETGHSFVFRHGVDDTEGAKLPPDSEFLEYPGHDQAEVAFQQQLAEARAAGEVIEEDSTDDIGDFETDGAEIRDLYADESEDELVRDPVISEEEEP